MQRELVQLVRLRAHHCCEYCQLPESAQRWQFEIDHIVAEQHGGQTSAENLALCCPKCNRHKGPNLSGVDPDSQRIVELFNPRKQIWSEHFHWNGPMLIGLTPSGRATVVILNINDTIRISVRRALIAEGVFPPT